MARLARGVAICAGPMPHELSRRTRYGDGGDAGIAGLHITMGNGDTR